ncbi:MAG: 2'-5' RNA ligase family protein [Phaeodactylibacter sp.]|nr:2'-5' RNA ligase family protein [Phaeodactylibacter sp.]MCB9300915.1 2'-5' RNA ligase family protein [Lewinellaceae bacterium]
MTDHLFFIAVLPDEAIQAEVARFKHYAARHFKSSRALRSPAHITLFSPFRWPPDKLAQLEGCLQRFARQERSFLQGLKNFNCFKPHVIFVDVERNDELPGLQNRLEEQLKRELELINDSQHDFNPHLTVAFKDLKRSIFPEAWEYFSRIAYERQFLVSEITLLENNGREWVVFEQFEMTGEES